MLRKSGLLMSIAIVSLALWSCSKQAAERRNATVVLQDGSQISGEVVSSSGSSITLAGGDKITRTIPMSQVKSVLYSDEPQASAQTPEAPPPTTEAPLPTKKSTATVTSESRRRPSPTDAGSPPPQQAPLARVFELPAGTELPVRTNETIDSSKAQGGQGFAAEVLEDVVNSAGAVVIPKGSPAQLVIVSASQGGKIRGASDLVLDLSSITVRGRDYQVDTADISQRGKEGVGANKRTATYTGGGAAVGAIIGAIAGGGKGAAIGAGAGAGAGALTQILTKGGAVRVPVESVLRFKLDSPLRVNAE